MPSLSPSASQGPKDTPGVANAPAESLSGKDTPQLRKEKRSVRFSSDTMPSSSQPESESIEQADHDSSIKRTKTPHERSAKRSKSTDHNATYHGTTSGPDLRPRRQASLPVRTGPPRTSTRVKVAVNAQVRPLASPSTESAIPHHDTNLLSQPQGGDVTKEGDVTNYYGRSEESPHSPLQSSSPGPSMRHPSSPSSIFASSPAKSSARGPSRGTAHTALPSSPLPPSSMPGSPATSVGNSSPTKSSVHDLPPDDVFSGAPDDNSSGPILQSSPIRPLIPMLEPSTPSKRSIGEVDSPSPTGTPSRASSKRLRMGDSQSSPIYYPATRRHTIASEKRAFKKLAAPFRSPLANRGAPSAKSTAAPQELSPLKLSTPRAITKVAQPSNLNAQFKSPLRTRGEGSSSRAGILPTQEIRDLEYQVSVLKRAIKIKRSNDEEKLAELTLKWRDAAREAAYDLWSIVRDTVVGGAGSSKSGGWASSWGWDDQRKTDGKDRDVEMRDKARSDEEEPEKQEETLGIMLRRLNIDPQTLGWDDAEECFLD